MARGRYLVVIPLTYAIILCDPPAPCGSRRGRCVVGRSRKTHNRTISCGECLAEGTVEGGCKLRCLSRKQLDCRRTLGCSHEDKRARVNNHRRESLPTGDGDLQQLWKHTLFQRSIDAYCPKSARYRGGGFRWEVVRRPTAHDFIQIRNNNTELSAHNRMRSYDTTYQMRS